MSENIIVDGKIRYVIIRLVQLISIGAFVFGTLWEGTIRFNLTTPQFLMMYGAVGAVISELLSRLFKKFEKKNIKKEWIAEHG